MNISSMVITLNDNVAAGSSIEELLAAISCIEVGQRHGCKIPIVLEAENESDSRDWFYRISQFPGVLKVEVAFVSFEDLNPVECQEVESQERLFHEESASRPTFFPQDSCDGSSDSACCGSRKVRLDDSGGRCTARPARRGVE